MLCHLEIQDFAIVDALTVTFEAGFTTITGETGAGKSIMLDALGLVLGDRAQGRLVREGRPSAQLAAEFSVAAIPKAQAWLDAQSLRDPDAPERCLLRRTLTEDGRSRAYINGRAVTLGELRALAELLIHSLDARGYLLHSPEELLVALNAEGAEGPHPLAPVTEEELSAAHGIVRQLDPPGVGARDLIDCLLVQLERDPGDYPLETILVRDHLQDIARNRLPQISKATGATIDEVKEGIEIIRSLQPNPGASFSNEPTQVVRPDVFIEEDEGELVVTVTDGYLPRLRVSQHYRELLQASRKDPEVRDYLRKKIEGAEWLLSAIHQRKSTLQRVAEEVVAYQTEFFREGERALRPLKMQDIADKIGVNVSTVSRAISGKYFQAPGMVRELKSLFTGGTVKDDGSSESRGSVILRIKDLIADENPKKPLSDSKIVSLLAEDGIHISRRTVTKYREAEGIPSSRERRAY